MKTLIVFALLFLLSPLAGQAFMPPKNVKLESAADYEAQQENVIAAVNYLENTPPDQEENHRKRVNTFLLQWLTGTPTVTLTLDNEIVTFMEQPDCFMLYMGAYARHSMQNGSKDAVAANLAAIKSVLSFYAANKDIIGKQKALEKYQKLANKGKLAATIEKLTKG